MNRFSVMSKTTIYIGLNDADSHEQKFTTERYAGILRRVCKNYSVPFSFTVSEGGYIHENGEYTQETSLQITLVDVEKTVVNEIAKDLCTFFHQESVLITEEPVRAYYIKDPLKQNNERGSMEGDNSALSLSQIVRGLFR